MELSQEMDRGDRGNTDTAEGELGDNIPWQGFKCMTLHVCILQMLEKTAVKKKKKRLYGQ